MACNGADVVGVKGDSGDTDSGIAPDEVDLLLKANSDVIVGAASSGVTMTVIDKIMSAGVVQFSPANTSTEFDQGDFADPDLYFRTAPSDILQGAVLSNLLIQDQRQNVAILARQDAYGETLAEEVTKGLENARRHRRRDRVLRREGHHVPGPGDRGLAAPTPSC